jgi:hypothetical protein
MQNYQLTNFENHSLYLLVFLYKVYLAEVQQANNPCNRFCKNKLETVFAKDPEFTLLTYQPRICQPLHGRNITNSKIMTISKPKIKTSDLLVTGRLSEGVIVQRFND